MTKLPHQLSLLSFLLNPLTLLIFVMSATLYFSARHRAYRHWESAELLEERGELQRAVLHYQWAARAYYPGSQVGHQALSRLWTLAQEAIRAKQEEEALYYLSLQRGAIRASIWLLSPYDQWVEPVDQALLKLYSNELDYPNQELIKANLKADLRLDTGQSVNIILSLIALALSLKYLMSFGLDSKLETTGHTRSAMSLFLCSLAMFYWALAL